MVIYEKLEGTDLVRAYSDVGFQIISEEDGAYYDEALDPVSANRVYTESDIPVTVEDVPEEEPETVEPENDEE